MIQRSRQTIPYRPFREISSVRRVARIVGVLMIAVPVAALLTAAAISVYRRAPSVPADAWLHAVEFAGAALVWCLAAARLIGGPRGGKR
jgi:hypothetical protein